VCVWVVYLDVNGPVLHERVPQRPMAVEKVDTDVDHELHPQLVGRALDHGLACRETRADEREDDRAVVLAQQQMDPVDLEHDAVDDGVDGPLLYLVNNNKKY